MTKNLRSSTTAKKDSKAKASAQDKGKGKAPDVPKKVKGVPPGPMPSNRKLTINEPVAQPSRTQATREPEPTFQAEPEEGAPLRPQEEGNMVRVVFTHKEMEDHKSFCRIQLHPTRFISKRFLESTGMEQDVRKILADMGLTRFSEIRERLFPELVRDFFATVELVYKKPRKPKPEEGHLRFMLWGTECRLTIAELCDIYGFANGSEVKFGEFEAADDFWQAIAVGSGHGNPKATLIRNPAIRFVHKFLANTLFARKQNGAVRKDELWLLFMGVRSSMSDEDGTMFASVDEEYVNLGCVFAKELTKIRAWGRNTTEPQCLMGSMLTPIFRRMIPEVDGYYKEPRTAWLNREYFVTCKYFEDTRDDTVYRYKYRTRNGDKRTMLLPNPEFTSLNIPNILFEHEGDDITIPVPRRERNAAAEPPVIEPQESSDPWELPELTIKPTSARERIFFNAYKMQKRINKMAKSKFNWLKSKLKKLPGYVSDEEEFTAREEAGERSSAPQEQGDQAAGEGTSQADDEARASIHGGEPAQEGFYEDHYDYQARFSYQGDYGTDHFFPTTYDLGGGSSSFRY